MHQYSSWHPPDPSNYCSPPVLCYKSKLLLGQQMFMFLHSKQAPAWTSSSPHLQHDCRPHHLPWGEKGQSPSQTHCPSSKGWQSRDTGWYTSWSSLCSWGRLSPTHLMPGKPWVSLSQPSSQHGGGLKAISPTSFCFKIILLPSFQQHV